MKSIAPLLVLMMVASALVPLGQGQVEDEPETTFCADQDPARVVFCDDFKTEKGWVPTDNELHPPGQAWHPTTNGNGDSSAWYAGIQAGVSEAGLSLDVGYGASYTDQLDCGAPAILLTSPVIDGLGLDAESLTFALRGDSEGAGYDSLYVETKLDGGNWVRQATYGSGSDLSTMLDPYGSRSIPASFLSDSKFQIRFVFTTDCTLDSTGGVGFGWWVDDLLVTIPATPPEPPEPEPEPEQGEATNIAPKVLTFTRNVNSVDLVANADGSINFVVDAQDDRRLVVASVYLRHEATGEIIRTTLGFASSQVGPDHRNETWTGALSVSDSRLRTGTWNVTAYVFDQQGGVNHSHHLSIPDLEVTAVGAGNPSITQSGGTSGTQVLGLGSSLRFTPVSSILDRVTYQMRFASGSVSPEFTLPSPYIINPESLPAGEMTIVARVYDRAGKVASVEIPVLVDTEPAILAAVVPSVAYQGVPFQLNLATKDHSTHTLSVSWNNETRNIVIPAGASVQKIPVRIDAVGDVLFALRVVDQAGNVVTKSVELTIVQAVADIKLDSLEILTSHPLPGTAVKFAVDVSQDGGVTTIPVDVKVAVGTIVFQQGHDLAIDGSAASSFEHVFAPGQYLMVASVAAVDGVNETDPTNQTIELPFEVFLGKVSIGDVDYYVRASVQGLPMEMVGPDEATYPLAIDRDYSGTLYRFELDGESYFWDPLEMNTEFNDPPAKKSPGAGVLSILAILGLAAVSLRRR